MKIVQKKYPQLKWNLITQGILLLIPYNIPLFFNWRTSPPNIQKCWCSLSQSDGPSDILDNCTGVNTIAGEVYNQARSLSDMWTDIFCMKIHIHLQSFPRISSPKSTCHVSLALATVVTLFKKMLYIVHSNLDLFYEISSCSNFIRGLEKFPNYCHVTIVPNLHILKI